MTHRTVARAWIRRFLAAEIIEFRPRPRRPSIKIGGRDYAKSTYGGPLGDALDHDEEQASGGARLVKMEVRDPWKFLWVFDTDQKYVAMWRVSDGSDKVFAPASTHTREIVMLEKRGELNRVTHAEFAQVERFMHRQHDAALESIKQYLAERATDEEKKLPPLLTEYFKRTIVPEFVKRMRRWESGARPLGFKPVPNSAFGPKRQLASWTMHEVMQSLWTLNKAEAFLKTRGIELGLLGNQDVDFAMKDVWFDIADEVLGPYNDSPTR